MRKFILMVLFFMLISGVFSYAANVKYHGLGSDARRVYVKEIKDVRYDKNYSPGWKCNGKYLVKNSVLYDRKTMKPILIFKGNIDNFTKDCNYMLTDTYLADGYNSDDFFYDIKNKKEVRIYGKNIPEDLVCWVLYDKDNLLCTEEIKKEKEIEVSIHLYNINTKTYKKMCVLKRKGKDSIDDLIYFNKQNIFVSLSYIGEEKEFSKVLRVNLENCSIKEIIKGKRVFFDSEQKYYMNNHGEIRLRIKRTVYDKDGKIIGIIRRNFKKEKLLCNLHFDRVISTNNYIVSPDDKFFLVLKCKAGVPPEDELCNKNGPFCILLYDFKGRVKKLNIKGLTEPFYWHPFGDRFYAYDYKNKRFKLVVLEREGK